jgi:muramidase (phage lysozyme)
MTPNQKAFLDMIAISEIGAELLALSDRGYNVLVGSTPEHPLLFQDYTDHPNILNIQTNSTAAGRYQVLHRYWLYYKNLLKLEDFAPDSQDAIALQYIKECKALDDIEAGNFVTSVTKCCHIWASLPGPSGYGQHQNNIAYLQKEFENAGGQVA